MKSDHRSKFIIFQPFRNNTAPQYVVNRNNNFVGANVVLGSSSIGAVDQTIQLKIMKERDLISDKLLKEYWLVCVPE